MLTKDQYIGFLDSNPIWKNTSIFQFSQFTIYNKSIDLPDDLDIYIPDNEVLGKRVERFFDYYIKQHKNYKVLLQNLQIFRDKTTIGELDFLVDDLLQKKVLHIELVYKFYIYDPNTSDIELERWIGPNRNDSLLQKISKLKKKQLPLLYKPETISILNTIDIEVANIEQHVCFLGNLFIPISYQNKSIPHLNINCIVGFWIHLEDFIKEKYGDSLYFIPQKKDWLVHPKQNTTWYAFDTIIIPIKTQLDKKKSPLLWIKNSEDSFSKCFVVWW